MIWKKAKLMHDDPDDVGYEWKRWRKKPEIRKQPLNCI